MRTKAQALLLTAAFGLIWTLAACGEGQQGEAGTYRGGMVEAVTAISEPPPAPAASAASAVR